MVQQTAERREQRWELLMAMLKAEKVGTADGFEVGISEEGMLEGVLVGSRVQ